MAVSGKKDAPDPAFDARLGDWLEEIQALNRLFLAYLRALAEDGRGYRGLSRQIMRSLRRAESGVLDRMAALPTALFHLRLDEAVGTRELIAPSQPTEQLRFSLTLQILNSAWHMARSRGFAARLFLHLSPAAVRRLRAMPLSDLPGLANAPTLLGCAFANGGLTWHALVRDLEPDASRMLVMIALQPALARLPPSACGTSSRALRS